MDSIHKPPKSETVTLGNNVEAKINYKKGTVTVGETTYHVYFGDKRVEGNQIENIMKIVMVALSQLGSELDPTKLDTLSINKEKISYKGNETDSFKSSVHWDQVKLDKNMKIVFDHVFPTSEKIHKKEVDKEFHDKNPKTIDPKENISFIEEINNVLNKEKENTPKIIEKNTNTISDNKKDMQNIKQIHSQENKNITKDQRNITQKSESSLTKTPEFPKNQKMSSQSKQNSNKSNLKSEQPKPIQGIKSTKEETKITPQQLKSECLKLLRPPYDENKLDYLIKQYQKNEPSARNHQDWFSTGDINSVFERLYSENRNFVSLATRTEIKNNMVYVNTTPVETEILKHIKKDSTEPVIFALALPGHFVVVYVDPTEKTVEYYDSMGSYAEGHGYNIKEQLNTLTENLKNQFDSNYRFVDRAQEIKNHKDGVLQTDGYACGGWACYFIERRLNDSNFDPSDIDRGTKEKIIKQYRLIGVHTKNIIHLYNEELKKQTTGSNTSSKN